MDHGKEYWFKQTFEQQKKDILIEFQRLTKFWGKSQHNINMLMNRCIKYTEYSLIDPKNAAFKSLIESLLEDERRFREDADNSELEAKIRNILEDKENKKTNDFYDPVVEFFERLESGTPQSRMTISQYDKDDILIATITGTFNEVFGKIKNASSYYFRVSALSQYTIRERIREEYYGIKTSCIGGLSFDLAEAVNRYLNYQVKQYEKGEAQNFFYTLCHIEWYNSLLEKLRKLSSNGLEMQLKKIQNSFPALQVISDLNIFRNKAGIYILVLDAYNVCYIGQSNNITGRIMRHWSRSDYFSGTGIDLFKAHDSTRIYALVCDEGDVSEIEYQMVDLVDAKYMLNVLAGGTIDYQTDNDLSLLKESDEEINPFEEILSIQKTAIEMEKMYIITDTDNHD